MSWSFTLLLCGTASPEPLIQDCTHSPERAAQILRDLGFDAREQSRPILNDALCSSLERNHIGVGAFKDIILFSDPGWLLGKNDAEVFNTIQEVASIPTMRVLYVQLAGVVSYQCYAYRVDGQLVRRFEADGNHLIDSTGDFLPVEQALFTAVSMEDRGSRFTVDGDGRQEEVEAGELPFAMMSMFFGVDYTDWPGEEPIVSTFLVSRNGPGRLGGSAFARRWLKFWG